jgi:transposase
MSETFSKVEVNHRTQKMAIIAETMQPSMSISYVARRHGLSPSLAFWWRSAMSEGCREAVCAGDDVVPASEARGLEEKVRELERLLGRKSMEVEILKEALYLTARAASRRPTGRQPQAGLPPLKKHGPLLARHTGRRRQGQVATLRYLR